jgi:HK97 family phage major capsid protein
MSKFLDELKELGKKSADDPVLEGVVQIGNALQETVHETEKRFTEISAETKKIQKTALDEVGKVRGEMEAAFDVVGAKLDNIHKNQVMRGGAFIRDATNDLVAAIPVEKRHYIGLAEQTMGEARKADGSRIEERGRLADPVFKAASALWFQESAKLMVGNRFRNPQASADTLTKIEAAFAASYAGDATSKAISDMAEGSNPSGGFLVPAPIDSEIQRLIADNSCMRPLVRKVTMTSKQLTIPVKGNSITAYIVAEGGNLTGSYDQTAFASATLTAKKFCGRTTLSGELLEDSIVGLLPYILSTLGEEIGILEDQETIDGSGTNFTGLIAATGVNSVATTTTNGEAIVYTDLTATVFKARHRSSRNNARWYMSPEIFGAIQGMVDTNGQPIVKYGTVPYSIAPTLLGYPVEVISSMSIATTRGSTGNTSNVYFGPPEAIIFGDRLGTRWDVSDAPNWGTWEIDARLIKRTGIVVAVPTAFTKLVGGTFA